MFPVTLIVLAALDMVSVFANKLVVVTAFEAYKLLDNERLDKFETCQTFRVPTFAVVAKMLVVVMALDT
jgi:hypothetical protein